MLIYTYLYYNFVEKPVKTLLLRKGAFFGCQTVKKSAFDMTCVFDTVKLKLEIRLKENYRFYVCKNVSFVVLNTDLIFFSLLLLRRSNIIKVKIGRSQNLLKAMILCLQTFFPKKKRTYSNPWYISNFCLEKSSLIK